MYRTKSSPLSSRVVALFFILLTLLAAPWQGGLAFAATPPYEQDPGTRGSDPGWPPGPPGEDGSDPDELEIYITIPGPGAEFGSRDSGRPNGSQPAELSPARLRTLATWVVRLLVTHH